MARDSGNDSWHRIDVQKQSQNMGMVSSVAAAGVGNISPFLFGAAPQDPWNLAAQSNVSYRSINNDVRNSRIVAPPNFFGWQTTEALATFDRYD